MESSKKSDDLIEIVAANLARQVVPGQRLTLALSGGVDSIVLLDILAQLRIPLKLQLSALYVNHQISPNASAWGLFCADRCARLGVPFASEAVTLARRGGESLEALAREARYAVLARQSTDFVVLAQHLDDQAETLLLQLLRGAGAKGLSAMPEVSGERWLRPLLTTPRTTIEGYARERGLDWIEDESNASSAFDRNYLRHEIFPVLSKRFPAYRETLARAGRHLAEAAGLLNDLAVLDAGDALRKDHLEVAVLRQLADARARNLLRGWLEAQGVSMPSARWLDELLRQLRDARPDAQVRMRLGGFEIRRYRGTAHVIAAPDHDFTELSLARDDPLADVLDHASPLRFERCVGQGISLARLTASPVAIRHRKGGERLRPDCRRPTRTLKNLLQESAMPLWRRESLPLLFSGERLVFVPGIGIDCEYQARESEPGLVVKSEIPV